MAGLLTEPESSTAGLPRVFGIGTKDDNWRFTQETVAAIEPLWLQWEKKSPQTGLTPSKAQDTPEVWLRKQFPETLQQKRLLLYDYQWFYLLVIILLGFVADLVTRLVLNWIGAAWFRFVHADVDRAVQKGLWKPMGLLTQALVWYAGTTWIGLPAQALAVLLVAVRFFAVVSAVWTFFRLIDLLASYLLKKAAGTTTKFDDLLVPLVSKSLKVFAACIGVLFFANMFDIQIMGLLGGWESVVWPWPWRLRTR